MKKYLALLFLFIFAGNVLAQSTTPLPPGQLFLDRSISGNITDTTCNSDAVTTTTFTQTGCVILNSQGATALTVNIGGTWAGYLFFEGTNQDTFGWQFINLYVLGSLTQYVTLPSFATGSIGGFKKFRVRAVGPAGSFSNTASVTINAANGKPPDIPNNIAGTVFFRQYTSDNPGEIIFTTSVCQNFPNLTLNINATGDNSGDGGMLATISEGNVQGFFATYKKVPIGSNVPAIINGKVNSISLKINIPYDFTAAGTVTITGDCSK